LRINALDLLNLLGKYSLKELLKLDVVIEIGRTNHNELGKSEYTSLIEEYPTHIRIINKL
jgi:hypothetical protein